ncbi:hypothetical protein NAP1_07250 [Erythrobacter sp. NAP1]|uniref:hypothetical protein n=1 Tax=Erythrobacter sp. NAP1 TaxID=237727 RepID=UPI00006869BE|nr:hypothetical protein [Erythrobacter sp. NAP1]EAQ30556.1 hypothetical protein NAP1_07250 [Erythrobacter sp. NAP1]
MSKTAPPWLKSQGGAALALLAPALGGLAYLAFSGAPFSYLLVNAGALVLALGALIFVRLPQPAAPTRGVAVSLLAVLALPLVTGPSLDGVSRWLPLGPLTLHAGFLAVPLFVRLVAHDALIRPWVTLTAILIAFAHPDTGTALALTFAAISVAFAARDRWTAVVAALGIFAAIGANFAGDLPPQPFVEGILTDLWPSQPLASAALAATLLASMVLVLKATDWPRTERFALAGALAGFTLAALLANYPYPLIGYGAASILGWGLALARRPANASKGTQS